MSDKIDVDEIDIVKVISEGYDLFEKQDQLRKEGMEVVEQLIRDPSNLSLQDRLSTLPDELTAGTKRTEELTNILDEWIKTKSPIDKGSLN